MVWFFFFLMYFVENSSRGCFVSVFCNQVLYCQAEEKFFTGINLPDFTCPAGGQILAELWIPGHSARATWAQGLQGIIPVSWLWADTWSLSLFE